MDKELNFSKGQKIFIIISTLLILSIYILVGIFYEPQEYQEFSTDKYCDLFNNESEIKVEVIDNTTYLIKGVYYVSYQEYLINCKNITYI